MKRQNNLARTQLDVMAAQASLALDGLVPIERLSAYLIAVATHPNAPTVAPDVVRRLGEMLHPHGSSAFQLKLLARPGKPAPSAANDRIAKRNDDFAKVEKVLALKAEGISFKKGVREVALSLRTFNRLREEFSQDRMLCRWIVDLKNRNDAHVANMGDPRYARAHAEQLDHINDEILAKK